MTHEIPHTVLIVDDDEDLLESMRAIFEDEGWQVVTHNGQKNILEFILSQNVSLVILDVFLPNDNGSEIARQVRIHRATQKIVLISAAAQLNRLGAAADVDDYLHKPFRLERLVELADRVLNEDTRLKRANNDQGFKLFQQGPLAYSQSHEQTE